MSGSLDVEERELFDKSLRHATATATGAALDAALDELGWGEALASDRRAAVESLFELQGAKNATSSALGRLVGAVLGLDAVAGGAAMPVVLPALGTVAPAGAIGGGVARVTGVAPAAAAAAPAVWVVASSGDGVVAAPVDGTALRLRPIRGLDPALGLVEVTGDAVRADWSRVAPGSWEGAVGVARVAVAHELVGASRAMLELARTHAVERVQFGRPIAAFQAVRHRLAECLVAVEAAAAAADAAWRVDDPITALAAKAIAGRSARTVARHAQQVLAGIGFTTEHPLHRYVRRVMVLDRLFGGSRSLTRELGAQLLATARLPAILPL